MDPRLFAKKWNLESIYPGGSDSPAFLAVLHKTKHDLLQFEKKFKQLSDLKKGILHFQELEQACHDLKEFVCCLAAQNASDSKASQLQSQVTQLNAEFQVLGEELNILLREMDEDVFESLLGDPDIEPIAFHLKEKRVAAKELLPPVQEKLIHRLSANGYEGWNFIYKTMAANLLVPSPFAGEKPLSAGQAENKLSHPDRNIRTAWFENWKSAWSSQEHLAAQMLNHLGGYRLDVYQARGWHSILQEPLKCNRMEEETLWTMWESIETHKVQLQKYLAKKAEFLGLSQLSWIDCEAPLAVMTDKQISFDEGARLIIECFHGFSKDMGAFAEHAFLNAWIEAEDRAGKSPGGFCVSFSRAKECRIFMTYEGTMGNLITLAHELGHAYHSDVLKEEPFFDQQYKMNIAEMASTLAEGVVIDGMLKQMNDPLHQLSLLDVKLQRAVVFLMNIQARFLFEMHFYKERRKGFLPAGDLNAMMVSAQKKAYGDVLADWNPHFWASKQHFYFSDIPFYNFPYTFGYLFSQGIYSSIKQETQREPLYQAILRDSGRLPTEELASRHIGANLKEHSFWDKALQIVDDDIETFLKLPLNK